MPILLSKKTTLFRCKRGCIKFENGKPRIGSLRIGLNDLSYSYESPSFVSIQGQMVLKGNGVHAFGPGVSLNIWDNATLVIGNNFSVAPHLRVFVSDCIEVGDNNMWSFYILIMDTDCHCIYNENGDLINPPQRVKIGNKCWIGAYGKILKGTTIPDDSIIGAGSVVSKKLSQSSVIYVDNNPIKNNINWTSKLI